MADHALLSASGSKKWLTCTPSARLEESFPDEQSSYAAEGTLAHAYLEKELRRIYFGEAPPDYSNCPPEMVEAIDVFIQECLKISMPLTLAGVPFTVLIEQRLDYSQWVPDGFGTGDFVLVSKHCLWVRDFKYGQGVSVAADENSQMMLYGLGAYSELGFAYDEINEVDIGIVQPRVAGGVSSWRIPLENLLAWGDSIKPVAAKAWAGEGEFVAGDHCSSCFCRARFTCRARAEQMLAVATEEFGDTPNPNLLAVQEIDALLPRLGAVAKWAADVEAHALKLMVDDGVRMPSHKLVEGRSNRFISDKGMAAVRLVANGYPQDQVQTKPELVGITALEKLCGKGKFEELLGDLIVKPPGKPTIAKADDPRPEWRPNKTADEDFAD